MDVNFKNAMVLTESQSIDYAFLLANALSALHDKKIVHRDIKSANVMVSIQILYELHFLIYLFFSLIVK